MFRLYDKINNNEVYIIAEMSANHGGSIENALELVRQSAEAGADCVKIQTYTADSLTIDCDNQYFRIQGGIWDGYKLYELYQHMIVLILIFRTIFINIHHSDPPP